jgi:hypothetical protein
VRVREIEQVDGRRTFVIVFDAGEEVAEGLLGFARGRRLGGAHFSAIGALSEVTLGFWDGSAREYRRIPVHEQVEVLSLSGNVAMTSEGEPKVHAHLVVGKADGTAHGGHLLAGRVRPTLEVFLVEVPARLCRRFDPQTGLALLDPDASA